MVASNYPQGINTPWVSTQGLPFHGGNIRFVGSAQSGHNTNNSGRTPDSPWATVAYAGANSPANALIVAMKGHAESFIVDDAIAWAVAGLHVLGMGEGAARPTFTVSTLAAASLIMDVAGTILENLLFIAGIDALTDPLVVNAADCVLRDIEWRDATGIESIDILSVLSGGTRCVLDGIKIIGTVSEDAGQSAIHLDGCDDVILTNFDLSGDFQTGVIENVGDEALNIRILGGTGSRLVRGGSRIQSFAPEDLAIVMDAAATGFIEGPIRIRLNDDAANIDQAVAPGTCQVYNTGANLIGIVNADGESELQWPGDPSTDDA